MNLWIVAAILFGMGCGAAAVTWLPWFSKAKRSDTAFLLKRGATQMRHYSPVVSRGTLWVLSGCLVLMLKTLMEWKAAGTVTEMDVKILWVGVAATAVDKALTYMDTTVARFKDEQKKRRDATEIMGKPAIGTDPEGHLR